MRYERSQTQKNQSAEPRVQRILLKSQSLHFWNIRKILKRFKKKIMKKYFVSVLNILDYFQMTKTNLCKKIFRDQQNHLYDIKNMFSTKRKNIFAETLKKEVFEATAGEYFQDTLYLVFANVTPCCIHIFDKGDSSLIQGNQLMGATG